MRKLSLFFEALLLLTAVLLMPSCQPDGLLNNGESGPAVNLSAQEPYVSQSATVEPGAWFEVRVTVSKGDNFLKSIVVKEDGIKIVEYATRLQYNNNKFEANPKLLIDMEKENLDWVIAIKAHEEAGISREYAIEFTDDALNSSSKSVSITTVNDPPSFSFVQEAPYHWENVEVASGSRFEVKITGEAGSSPLSTIGVYETETAISNLTRLRYDDIEFTANPLDIPQAAKNTLEWVINIKAHEEYGAKEYKIVVEDEAGNSTSLTLNVSVGTATTNLTGKLLLNSGGPTGTGGLNLLTGEGTGSADSGAHIKDMGIDTNMPVSSNWLKKIAGINGSSLRIPGSNMPEGFSFDKILFKEEISGAYDLGTDITESDPVQVGDIFIIMNGEMRFLLTVTTINETTADNADSIEFSIKY